MGCYGDTAALDSGLMVSLALGLTFTHPDRVAARRGGRGGKTRGVAAR